ncbi:DUF5681 domain-containing protein [Qipengyuania sp.]|uniref:DUF5681 domain-containing protein n=1 Tax=Qipengyuania sp. TaxID=2004515 RepID=UPI003BAA6E68
MSKDTRFRKGRSGNPKGRPRKSAGGAPFDIILDKRIPGVVNGEQRELTAEEAMQRQTLKDAFAGKRLAIRRVLKWIEERDAFLNRKRGKVFPVRKLVLHYSSDNANAALDILGIAEPDMRVGGVRWNVHTWATQAALSRPGRRKFNAKQVKDIKFFTFHPHKLRWPKGRIYDE